ncbi:hypothetical protein HHI36_008652, partial [Cryptolaemus montrouzieri]
MITERFQLCATLVTAENTAAVGVSTHCNYMKYLRRLLIYRADDEHINAIAQQTCYALQNKPGTVLHQPNIGGSLFKTRLLPIEHTRSI